MTEQTGSATHFSSATDPRGGSITIDSIPHESIFCPTRVGDIFVFYRRQHRAEQALLRTHGHSDHPLLPWVSSLVHRCHKMPSLRQKTLSSNAVTQRIWVQELSPQLWVSRPCPSVCPHSAKQGHASNEPCAEVSSWLTLAWALGTTEHLLPSCSTETSNSTDFHTFPVG